MFTIFNLLKNAICCFQASNPFFLSTDLLQIPRISIKKAGFFPKLRVYTTYQQHHLCPSITQTRFLLYSSYQLH